MSDEGNENKTENLDEFIDDFLRTETDNYSVSDFLDEESIKTMLINDIKSLEITEILYFNCAERINYFKNKINLLNQRFADINLAAYTSDEKIKPLSNDNSDLIDSAKKYVSKLIEERKEFWESKDIDGTLLLCGNSITIFFLSILIVILYLLSPTRYLKQGLAYLVNKYKIPFAFKNKKDKKDNNSNPQEEDPRNKKKFSVGGLMFLLVKGVLMVLINGVYMPISTVDNALKLFGAGVSKIFRGLTYISGAKQTKEAAKEARIFKTRRELGLKTLESSVLSTKKTLKSRIQNLLNNNLKFNVTGIKNNLRESEIIKPLTNKNNKNKLKEQRLRIKNRFFEAEKKLSRAISGKDLMNNSISQIKTPQNKNSLEQKQQNKLPNSEIINTLADHWKDRHEKSHDFHPYQELKRDYLRQKAIERYEAREEKRNEKAIEQAVNNYNNQQELSNTKQATHEVDSQVRAQSVMQGLFGGKVGAASDVNEKPVFQEPIMVPESPKVENVKVVEKENDKKSRLDKVDEDIISDIFNFYDISVEPLQSVSQEQNIENMKQIDNNKPEIQLGKNQQKELKRKQQTSIDKNTGPNLW